MSVPTTKYVTLSALIAHSGKSRPTVWRALRASGVKVESFPGVQGKRIATGEANRFLALHWPNAGPLQLPTNSHVIIS